MGCRMYSLLKSDQVRIFEVGPRDGLQNEKRFVPTETKLSLIHQLSQTGLKHIEATSFVSPKWVPQMADATQVYKGLVKTKGVVYPVLVPNVKGMESALEVKADEVAVFCAASEAFSQKNINCSIQQSLDRFIPVIQMAQKNNIPIRGYVSTVIGCPYAGDIDPKAVASVAERLNALGCYEVSLGDTIGVGNPLKIKRLIETVSLVVPLDRLAVHFHDTYGQAIANILKALEMGIRVVDSSVAGLGGCPYAKGATGNVATEDVVYLAQGLGLHTGVDLPTLAKVGNYISKQLHRPNGSKTGLALVRKLGLE